MHSLPFPGNGRQKTPKIKKIDLTEFKGIKGNVSTSFWANFI